MHPVDKMVLDAERGEPSTLLRDGVPVAVVVGYDDLCEMRAEIERRST